MTDKTSLLKKLFIAASIFLVIFMLPLTFSAINTKAEQRYTDVSEAITASLDPDGEITPLSRFVVTKTNSTIYTFDKTRNIAGVTEANSLVTITVYRSDENDSELDVSKSYTVEVGSSGIFAKEITLDLGESIVLVSAEKDGAASWEVLIINRKSEEVKNAVLQTLSEIKPFSSRL